MMQQPVVGQYHDGSALSRMARAFIAISARIAETGKSSHGSG